MLISVNIGYGQKSDTASTKQQQFIFFHKSITKNQKPFLKFCGGITSYNYTYSSFIDTPFIGTNTSQHRLTGSLKFEIGNTLPVKVNYLTRYSNSEYLKTIKDIQVIFDGANYRNNLNLKIKQELLGRIPAMKDSLSELTYNLKLQESNELGNWIQRPDLKQKLIESQEIIQIPDLVRNYSLPDSISKARADSIIREAQNFITFYANKKKDYDSVIQKVDSLKEIYDRSLSDIQKYKDLINSGLISSKSLNVLQKKLANDNRKSSLINRYKWLSGIKQLAVGKNIINQSELTAKNINSTGLNFEYNSWYYLAITAGTIDYRFKDFLIKTLNKSPQYLYLGRLGVGNIDANSFVVSLFKGQKQIFAQSSSNARSTTIDITGLSLESRWRLNKNSFIVTEVAQSQLPNYPYNQAKSKKLIDFSVKTNKAFSFKINYDLPHLRTRLDGAYKYTGANFQSFTSFQTNSSTQAWQLKLNQYIFNSTVKISASIKKNEFTNPLIIQNYKTNTAFKSLNAVYHKRNYPTVGISYAPIVQLTFLNNELSESKFYSLSSNVNYSFRLKDCQALTSIIYSKFYNREDDKSFLFYNSNNLLINQTFINKIFTQGFGISYCKNEHYQLLVIDGSISFNVANNGYIGMGTKINNLNKIGPYWKTQLNLNKLGAFRFTYDRGYLPGNNYTLLKNDNLSMGFTKTL